MKRVAILLGLAVVVGLMAMLLMSMNDEDGGRERREGGSLNADRNNGEGSGEPGSPADGSANPTGTTGVDDDPNRVPGPDVTVSGVVLFDGAPVPKAKVQLLRAYPADPKLQLSWTDPRWRTMAPAPLVASEADENGRFTLTCTRRSRLEVRAWGEKTSIGTANLFVPKEGDPTEVVVRVGPAFEITGVVVNESGEPVEGARLTSSSSSWRSYPFLQDAETAADGKFGFASLGRGSHTLIIEKEGYPTLQRSYVVPEATELRVELVVGGSIAGTLKTDAGTPVGGARILLGTGDRSRNAYGYVEAMTNDSGAYSFPIVVPGAINSAIVEHVDWGRRESSRSEIILPREVIKAGKTLAWDIELSQGVTVRGIVVDKKTQKPVPNAKLTFMRNTTGSRSFQAARRDQTDAEGRFTVQHLLEGTYAVDVRGDHHLRAIAQWMQPNQKMATDFFADGVNSRDDVRIEVGGSARVEGHVKVEDMTDFTNTWVQIPELNNGVNSRADSTGFFVFENVPAGEPIKLKTWMPAAESDPFTVQVGETKTVDLNAEGAPQFTGTVLGSNGEPVVGAYVKAAAANNARNEFRQILQQRGRGGSRTDAQGRFSIRLQGWQLQQAANQKWMIAAVSYEYPLQVTSDIRVPKEGQSVDVQITLLPGGKISGTVEFDGRGPLANARVAVSPKAPDRKAGPTDPRVGRYVYTDLAGRFSLAGIGSGDWTVTTSHPDGKAEAQSATAGDAEVRLILKPTLALAGIVVDEDDKPLAKVRISAIIPVGQKEQRRSATTDSSGRFRIAQLEPGDYELEALPVQNQQMYYGGSGQATGGFKKTRTKAYPAGTESIVVQVEPGNKIAGRVLGPTGKPVGGASLIAMPVGPHKGPQSGAPISARPTQNPSTTFTDGKGRFTLKGVGDGQYEVVAIASGYLISSAQASVGQTDVEINVEEGATIEGLLLAPDGEPLGVQWINFQALDPAVQKKFAQWSARGGNAWNNIGGWQASSTSTKPDGTFKATGLFPGKYKVNIYTQRGVVPNTELHTGSGKTTIRLTEGLTISGTILDEDGNPPVVATGQQVWVSANANGQWKSAQPDSDGSFELKGLPPGAVKLQVWAGNTYNSTNVDAVAGDTGVRITVKKRVPRQPK